MYPDEKEIKIAAKEYAWGNYRDVLEELSGTYDGTRKRTSVILKALAAAYKAGLENGLEARREQENDADTEI